MRTIGISAALFTFTMASLASAATLTVGALALGLVIPVRRG